MQKNNIVAAVLPNAYSENVEDRAAMHWFNSHLEQLVKKYPGEWVAISFEGLVSHNLKITVAAEEAKDKGVIDAFISKVPIELSDYYYL